MADPTATFKYDRVIFSCNQGSDQVKLRLKLQGPWVRSCGMEPDANQALVLAEELEQLTDLNDVEGDVKFYYTAEPSDDSEVDEPDVTLRQIAILSVTPDQIGTVDVDDGAGGRKPQTKVIWYYVVFVDARRKYVWPRGGMLNLGEVNKEPFQLGGVDDENGEPVRNPQQLVNACLEAMGLATDAPFSLSDYPQPRNLNWRASHAPGELAKVVNGANHRVFVDEFGDLQIKLIGADDLPTWPEDRLIVNVSRPSIDLRGKVVVVTGAPMAIMVTRTITGVYDEEDTKEGTPLDDSQSPKWEFVCRDKDGRWKPLGATEWFKNEPPQQAVRNGFKNVDPKFRAQVDQDTYYCLRLRPGECGPATLERWVYDIDPDDKLKRTIVQRPIMIQAKVAVVDANTGLWTNATDYSTFPASTIANGAVFTAGFRLGKVFDGVGTSDPSHQFVPLTGDELKIQCSREKNEFDKASGRWKPQYYMLGVKSGESSRLTDDEIKVALTNPDTIVVRRPELRPLILEGEFQGIKEIDDRAGQVAAAYNRKLNAPQSKLVMIKGYYACELSGRVERVEIDPQALVTRAHIDMFWMPGASYLPAAIAFDRPEKNEKHPGQLATASERTASGSPGYTQPTALLSVPQVTIPPTLRYAKVSTYDPGSSNVMVGVPCDANGQNAGTNTLRLAILEGGYAPPLASGIPGAVFAYLPYQQRDPSDLSAFDGVLAAPAFESLTFAVNLVKTTGNAGSATTPCTYVYDVYGFNGPGTFGAKLMTSAGPLYSPARMWNMTTQPALYGMATQISNAGYYLMVAFETIGGSKKC